MLLPVAAVVQHFTEVRLSSALRMRIVVENLETRKQVNLKNYGEKHMTIPEAKRTARIIEW